LFTAQQPEYAKKAAVEEAREDVIDEFQKMMKNAFRGSRHVTYKAVVRRTGVPSDRNILSVKSMRSFNALNVPFVFKYMASLVIVLGAGARTSRFMMPIGQTSNASSTLNQTRTGN